jgi:DNA invertase Pin-like site-specific DNA recombinase
MIEKARRHAAIYLCNNEAPNRARRKLTAIAEKKWRLVGTYMDDGIGRSEFRRLQAAVMDCELDVLLLWDINELGSSLSEIIETLAWFHEEGVSLYVSQLSMCSDTPEGRVVMRLIRRLAELHRARAKATKPERS